MPLGRSSIRRPWAARPFRRTRTIGTSTVSRAPIRPALTLWRLARAPAIAIATGLRRTCLLWTATATTVITSRLWPTRRHDLTLLRIARRRTRGRRATEVGTLRLLWLGLWCDLLRRTRLLGLRLRCDLLRCTRLLWRNLLRRALLRRHLLRLRRGTLAALLTSGPTRLLLALRRRSIALAPRIAAALSTPLTTTIAWPLLRTLLALALIALAPLIVLVLLL